MVDVGGGHIPRDNKQQDAGETFPWHLLSTAVAANRISVNILSPNPISLFTSKIDHLGACMYHLRLPVGKIIAAKSVAVHNLRLRSRLLDRWEASAMLGMEDARTTVWAEDSNVRGRSSGRSSDIQSTIMVSGYDITAFLDRIHIYKMYTEITSTIYIFTALIDVNP